MLILAFMTRDIIERVEDRIAPQKSFIKLLVVEVELMKNKTDDSLIVKKLKELEETIKYSDPMSHESLGILENKIESKVAELSELIGFQNDDALILINEITGLFLERNNKTKEMK